MVLLSHLYGAIARQRRRWYDRHPEARRRLRQPVISVGNLALGGTGKSPTVAHLARLLIERGEVPSVLSRGYARRAREEGVVVVRAPARLCADLPRAGDEPLMLARCLEGAAVVVGADRYLAGRLAEHHLGCTVHLLDDGFQHMMLERDVDLLLGGSRELADPRTLPAGRLREPIEAAAWADAVVLTDGDGEIARRWGALGVATIFRLARTVGAPRLVEPYGRAIQPTAGARVLAVAGIAEPGRFFEDVRGAGWTLIREIAFGDHHPYSRQDVQAIVRQAAADRVDLVVTTEKDLMRLLPYRPIRAPLAWVPLEVRIEPADLFATWLMARLVDARARAGAPGGAA